MLRVFHRRRRRTFQEAKHAVYISVMLAAAALATEARRAYAQAAPVAVEDPTTAPAAAAKPTPVPSSNPSGHPAGASDSEDSEALSVDSSNSDSSPRDEREALSPPLVEPRKRPSQKSLSQNGRRRDKARSRATTISGSQLAELGFFQDFEELSLDALLDPDVLEVTTSLNSMRELSLEAAPGAVSVLTAADIANLGVHSLDQLLSILPGFDVLTDSLGRSRVIARGMPTGGMLGSSENIVFLINGSRLNEAVSGGATALNLSIPTNHIKKLEVLRGPATTVYGYGAISAVINIVTNDPGEFMGIRVGSGWGSHWTHQQSLTLGNSLREMNVAASVHLSGSEGSRLLIPADARTLQDQLHPELSPISLAPHRTGDDYSMLDTLYRIAYRNYTLDWRAHQQRAGSYVGYANAFGENDSSFSKQMFFNLGYKRELERLGSFQGQLTVAFSNQRDLYEVVPPGLEGTDEEGRQFRMDSGAFLRTALGTRRYTAQAQLTRTLGLDHRLLAGVVLEREETYSLEASGNISYSAQTPLPELRPIPQAVPDIARNVFSVFIQDAWTPTLRLALTGGLRLDSMSDVDVFVSPSFAAILSLPRDLTLKVLYARAFRPPTFAEQAFNLPGYAANPDLRAVSAQSLESVLMLRRHNLRFAVDAFASFIRNSIPNERPISPFVSQPLGNAPGFRSYGLECEGRVNLGLNTFFTSYTLQKTRDKETGSRIANLPTHLATLGATLALGDRYSLCPLWRMRSARPRASGDARRRVPAVGWLDLTFRAIHVYETLEIAFTFNNLFDQSLYDPAPLGGVPGDYPRPGRSVFLQATYQF